MSHRRAALAGRSKKSSTRRVTSRERLNLTSSACCALRTTTYAVPQRPGAQSIEIPMFPSFNLPFVNTGRAFLILAALQVAVWGSHEGRSHKVVYGGSEHDGQ